MSELVKITVSRSNFNLKKVKFDGTKVEVSGKVKMSVNGGVLQEKSINEVVESYPHPDFIVVLGKMKPYLLHEWNFNHAVETVNAFVEIKDMEKGMTVEESKIIMELRVFIENKVQEMSEKITVTGASVSGKTPGIVITGKNKPEDKQIAMNMPRRTFEKDEEGNGGSLYDLWVELEDETFELLYKGKQAQQSIIDFQEQEDDNGVLEFAEGDSEKQD